MARKHWFLAAFLAVPMLAVDADAQSNTIDYFDITPDSACVRIKGTGKVEFQQQFTAIGWNNGPNAVNQNYGGDDINMGAVQVAWSTPSDVYDAHSGQTAFTESPNGNYGNNWNVNAEINPSFNLSGASSASVEFWHHYELENNYDYGFVEIRTNGGGSWNAIATYDGTLGGAADFSYVSLNLAAYLGQSIEVRFRVDTDGSQTREGWVIDDVVVRIDGGEAFNDDFESGLGNWSISSQWGETLPVSVASLGTINPATGLFTAGSVTGEMYITATAGSVQKTALVRVYPPSWMP